MKKIYAVKTSERHKDMILVDLLSERTKLSKSKIKELLNRGSVWQKNNKKMKRIRRAQSKVLPGEHYNVYFDSDVTDVDVSGIRNIHQTNAWSVWYKPAGILSQGTKFGDQASILRFVEKQNKETYLVHRLDRETAGLMIFAHTKKLAKELSEMFQDNKIKKTYQAQVLGVIEDKQGTIDYPLEEKEAITHWKRISDDGKTTLIEVTLETGRLHQVRKHFDMVGHPLMGDPKYGEGNKNRDGLKLIAQTIEFSRVNDKKTFVFTLPKELCLF